MAVEHFFKARATAGRASVIVAGEHPHDVAADTISGLAQGFLLAAAEMRGWDTVLQEVNQLATAARVPADKGVRPVLVVSK